ncbi:MAG TPA: hypothetical protein VHD60_03150 [Candidatus Saccharimonadales bacterium]|nr:hypothetical protein [Candidatus Saccharimonadales bacterium]
MLTTPHAVTGAILGALLPTPLAIPTSIASHYVLDSVPHWQETLAPYMPTRKTYIRIPIDIALAVGLTFLIAHWHPVYQGRIWWSAFAANAPDLDSFLAVAPHFKRGLLKVYWDWHCSIQRETSRWYGVLTQLAVIGIALYVSAVA